MPVVPSVVLKDVAIVLIGVETELLSGVVSTTVVFDEVVEAPSVSTVADVLLEGALPLVAFATVCVAAALVVLDSVVTLGAVVSALSILVVVSQDTHVDVSVASLVTCMGLELGTVVSLGGVAGVSGLPV